MAKTKKTIMVIDDEPDTVEIVQTILEMKDFKVLAYTNAQKALDALKSKEDPDLVLLDMRMPEISGPDFCNAVHKNSKHKNLKIVFFTASSDVNLKLAKKHGVKGFIFKPFDNEKLLKDINKFLKK